MKQDEYDDAVSKIMTYEEFIHHKERIHEIVDGIVTPAQVIAAGARLAEAPTASGSQNHWVEAFHITDQSTAELILRYGFYGAITVIGGGNFMIGSDRLLETLKNRSFILTDVMDRIKRSGQPLAILVFRSPDAVFDLTSPLTANLSAFTRVSSIPAELLKITGSIARQPQNPVLKIIELSLKEWFESLFDLGQLGHLPNSHVSVQGSVDWNRRLFQKDFSGSALEGKLLEQATLERSSEGPKTGGARLSQSAVRRYKQQYAELESKDLEFFRKGLKEDDIAIRPFLVSGDRTPLSNHLVFAHRLADNAEARIYMDEVLDLLYEKVEQEDRQLASKLIRFPAPIRHITFVGGSLTKHPRLGDDLAVFRRVASKTPAIDGDIGRLVFFKKGSIVVFEFDPATDRDLEAIDTMTSELLDQKPGMSDFRPRIRYHVTALHVKETLDSREAGILIDAVRAVNLEIAQVIRPKRIRLDDATLFTTARLYEDIPVPGYESVLLAGARSAAYQNRQGMFRMWRQREAEYISKVNDLCENFEQTAAILGVDRRTVSRQIQRYRASTGKAPPARSARTPAGIRPPTSGDASWVPCSIEEFKRRCFVAALVYTGGNVAEATKLLAIDHTTAAGWIAKLQIDVDVLKGDPQSMDEVIKTHAEALRYVLSDGEIDLFEKKFGLIATAPLRAAQTPLTAVPLAVLPTRPLRSDRIKPYLSTLESLVERIIDNGTGWKRRDAAGRIYIHWYDLLRVCEPKVADLSELKSMVEKQQFRELLQKRNYDYYFDGGALLVVYPVSGGTRLSARKTRQEVPEGASAVVADLPLHSSACVCPLVLLVSRDKKYAMAHIEPFKPLVFDSQRVRRVGPKRSKQLYLEAVFAQVLKGGSPAWGKALILMPRSEADALEVAEESNAKRPYQITRADIRAFLADRLSQMKSANIRDHVFVTPYFMGSIQTMLDSNGIVKVFLYPQGELQGEVEFDLNRRNFERMKVGARLAATAAVLRDFRRPAFVLTPGLTQKQREWALGALRDIPDRDNTAVTPLLIRGSLIDCLEIRLVLKAPRGIWKYIPWLGRRVEERRGESLESRAVIQKIDSNTERIVFYCDGSGQAELRQSLERCHTELKRLRRFVDAKTVEIHRLTEQFYGIFVDATTVVFESPIFWNISRLAREHTVKKLRQAPLGVPAGVDENLYLLGSIDGYISAAVTKEPDLSGILKGADEQFAVEFVDIAKKAARAHLDTEVVALLGKANRQRLDNAKRRVQGIVDFCEKYPREFKELLKNDFRYSHLFVWAGLLTDSRMLFEVISHEHLHGTLSDRYAKEYQECFRIVFGDSVLKKAFLDFLKGTGYERRNIDDSTALILLGEEFWV
ncbi:MAG: hypothetical protein WCG06_01400, partial [Candidatus Omnitrophota bacterium]